MVTCFSVLTAAVVIAALLRSRKGRKTARLITVMMIALFIVSVFGIAFAATPVFRPIMPPLGLEIAAAVLQFVVLFFVLLKSNENAEKNGAPISDIGGRTDKMNNKSENADIKLIFDLKYAPYHIDHFKDEPRDFDELSMLEIPERHVARAVDERRAEHPYAGAGLAAKEIFLNLTNWLNGEKGVHAETLLAVLGSLGGSECRRGIMTALGSVAVKQGRKYLTAGELFALGIMIVDTKSGEKYIMGDKIANEFCSFYMTAAKDNTHPFEVLKPLSEKCASTVGSEEYWSTPFGEYVSDSPKALADRFEGKFEVTFATYCRYPHERMVAMALAAQRAVEEAVKVMPKERAMSILAEFGWRTSHYIGKEL